MRSGDCDHLLIARATFFLRARRSRLSFENRLKTPIIFPGGSLYGRRGRLHAKRGRLVSAARDNAAERVDQDLELERLGQTLEVRVRRGNGGQADDRDVGQGRLAAL